MKKTNDKKNLEILKNIKIAHRGLWNETIPENSIEAFKRCIDKNIPIELDIHLLKDNTLVVFHDNTLSRLIGKDIVLKDLTYDELKKFNFKNTNSKIPTLKEVLELVDGKVLLDIELKTDVKGFKICSELCKLLDNYKGEFIVKSFNHLYIWWFRINRPNYIRGLLVSKLKNANKLVSFIIFNMVFKNFAKPDFIAFNYKFLPNKKIEKLRKNGIPILLFTIKEKNIEYYNNEDFSVIYEEK